jgi:hypothetical protein
LIARWHLKHLLEAAAGKDAGPPEQQQLETFRASPSGSLAKEQISLRMYQVYHILEAVWRYFREQDEENVFEKE